MEKFEEMLKQAKKLIDEGKIAEADSILGHMLTQEMSLREQSTFNLVAGLHFYNLGKEEVKEPILCGRQVERFLGDVINLNVSISEVNKALEILPLSCQNLLRDHQKAVKFARMATSMANPEDKPQSLNREGLIEREAGLFESLNTFSRAHSVAREKGNFKEAGNALFNKAETLIVISNEVDLSKEALIDEIRIIFSNALSSYKEHERRTKEDMEIYKNNVEEKIQGLAFLVK